MAEAVEAVTVAREPGSGQRFLNSAFRRLCQVCAAGALVLVVFIVLRIALSAAPSLREQGVSFLTGTTWDPNKGVYSIRPEIWGTLYTSILALVLGTVLGVAAALFLAEGYLGAMVYDLLKAVGLQHKPVWKRLPAQVESVLRNLVELLAAIPSVVYGLWGIFVVIPAIRPACNWLYSHLGWLPIFSSPLAGPGVLPAVIVLSIMILPTITAIGRHALVSVPEKLRMAAYGLGATRWESIFGVLLPTAARGIFGGVVLAFGRALGETMALAMLVGNANRIGLSLFSPANTLAALLANNFPEAGPKTVPVLMYAALVLLAITLAVNVAGALILQRASANLEGGK